MLSQLSGAALTTMSELARRRLLALTLGPARVRRLGHLPRYPLQLFVALAARDDRLITHFRPETANLGIIDRRGRGLALLGGSDCLRQPDWQHIAASSSRRTSVACVRMLWVASDGCSGTTTTCGIQAPSAHPTTSRGGVGYSALFVHVDAGQADGARPAKPHGGEVDGLRRVAAAGADSGGPRSGHGRAGQLGNGQRTTSANFVFYDRSGRLWLTCLTREDHWWPAVAHPRPDGFIVLVDHRGARIVADGIHAANEVRLDAEERYLYVAETMKARILRFPVRADGLLGDREVFGPDGLGPGGLVDGFTFDAEGNLWVTTVVRNGLGVLTRDGDWHVVVEDPREDALAAFADKLAAGTVTPDDLLAAAGPRLQFPTSVCFGGQDLRTVYVGSLAMSRLPTFRSPVPGLPMSHWR